MRGICPSIILLGTSPPHPPGASLQCAQRGTERPRAVGDKPGSCWIQLPRLLCSLGLTTEWLGVCPTQRYIQHCSVAGAARGPVDSEE